MWIIRGFLLIPLALALGWLALAPTARAVDPPPDGGYPGENTAEGEDALFSLTTGVDNTAVGFQALYSNTFGGYSTAVGNGALYNSTGSPNTTIGAFALTRNRGGFGNTAIGYDALAFNTTEHGKVEEQEATIRQVKSTVAQQEATIAQQQKEIQALGAGLKEQALRLQKVSERVEASRPVPQLVADN